MSETPSAASDPAELGTGTPGGGIEDGAGPAVRCDVAFLGGSRWLRREADILLGEGVSSEIVARSAARQAEADLRSAEGVAEPPGPDAGIDLVLHAYEAKGYGSFTVPEHDPDAGWLLVEARGTFESRAHALGGDLTDYATCDVMRGLILGAYRFLRRQADLPAEGLTAVEVSCEARGDVACRFAVGAPDVLRARGVEPVTATLTSRHELEEMLRRSREAEAGLSSFLQEMPFGVVRLDAGGRITFANRKTLEMLGVPLRAAAGRHFTEFLHPDDRELVTEGFRRVVEGRADPYPVPCRAVSSDGTVRPVAVDAFPVVDERGRPAGYEGIVIDLEDRERLGVPGLRFREGLRAAPRAYLEVDPGGSIRHANPAALSLLGIAPDDAGGAPLSRIFAGKSAPEAFRAFTEVAAGRSGYAEGRWEVERPGGGRRALRIEFVADGLATGRIERVLVLAEEVPGVDGRRAPADGPWTRALIEHGASVYAVVDAEGKTLYESPSLERVYGWKPEEIVGRSIFDLVHPDDVDLATQRFGEVLRDPGVPKSVEIRYRHKDGSWRTIEVSGVNLLDDKSVGGIVLTSHDVTAHRHAEAALEASEARYRALFEAAPVGIGMADTEGRVVAANRQMQEMNGYTLEEFQAVDLADTYVDRADRERLLDILTRSGKVRDFQTRLKRKDGTVYDAVLGVDLVALDGRQTLLSSVRDVSADRHAEQALREAEERWRSLAENSPDIIMTVDRSGTIGYINRIVVGFDAGETVGTSIFDYIDPGSHDRVRGAIDRVFATGRPDGYEIAGAGPDGRESRYETRVLPIVREGQVVAAIHIATDITDRSRSEEALRDSEERFRTFAEMLPEIVYEADSQGRIVFTNRQAYHATGYAQEDIDAGLTVADLVAPEDRPRGAENVKRILEGEPIGLNEYTIRRRDGSTFPALVRSERIVKAGAVAGLRGILVDISERKAAETALRESEAKYRGIFENLHDTYFRTDLDGKLLMVSPSGERIFGYTVDEVIGRDLGDFYVDPHDRAEARRLLQEQGQLREFEARLRRKDGTVIWVSSNCRFQKDADGNPCGVEGITRDITARRQAAGALKESEELHRTLMDALPDAVTMTDLEGRITYASQRALEQHGADSPEELVGQSSFDLIAPEDRQVAAANLLKTIEKGALRGMEYALLRKDGSRFPGELSAAVVPDARGKPKGFVAITRDLTEHKRAEEALREAKGEREELAFEVATLRSELQGRYGPDSIIGQDPKMRAIYDTILAVGPTNATVLIQGDTGTGKELVAKAVHYNSTRADRAFVKVDCGALAETLLESELFGHVKGAYTGAIRERAGRFELAHEGTVFLDEVQNLSMPLQAKLLRVVQEGRFEKVGGTKTVEVDVRIVAATNEDLARLVGKREFRKDLYYRLNVIPIRLPPLAERRGDVPLLARCFLKRFAERHGKTVTDVSQEALDKLMGYDWPGNVRELENIVEQAVVFSRGRTIEADEIRLPELDKDRGSGFWAAATSRPLRKALEAPERKILVDALARTNGNKKRAAELLGISRSAFYEKLRRHGLSGRS